MFDSTDLLLIDRWLVVIVETNFRYETIIIGLKMSGERVLYVKLITC